MRVVVAIDSFKGSLSSLEAGEAIGTGIHAADVGAEVVVSPLGDGGEGTVDAIVVATGGRKRTVRVCGPLGKPVVALAGCVTAEAVACNAQGIDAFFPILPAPCTLTEAMAPENAKSNLARTAEQVYRLATAFAFRK